MERISRGFRLLGASWEVLKADRELLVLPLMSFVAMALAMGVFVAAVFGSGTPGTAEEGLRTLDYVLLGIFFFITYFIGIFFNAAVVGAATIRLEGGDPTVRDGLRAAYAKLDKIFIWAVLAASVGLILRALEERAGFLGRIVIAIVGAAWSAITFFVVPVLLYEPVSATGAVKRSAAIFRQRWGEQFTGNVSLGLAMFVIALPVGLVVALLASVAPPVAIAVGVVAFGLLAAAGSAMTGIFNAALYRFAITGEASGGFREGDLSGAFRARGRRGLLG